MPKQVVKIVDVKCSDSGEGDSFRMSNLEHLTLHDEVKFVISSRRDYEFARDFTREHALDRKTFTVLFSPAFRKDAVGTRDASNVWSTRRIWRSGCWPMRSTRAWDCRFTSSSGSRR